MRIVPILFMTGLITGSAVAAGFFDRIKKKAADAIEQEVNREIDEQIDSVQKEVPSEKPSSKPDDQANEISGSEHIAVQSESDLYGRWEGQVAPTSHSVMERVGLTILIAPDFSVMHAQAAGSRCLAELKPTQVLGAYEAVILNNHAAWGTKATVAFADGGQVTVTWADAPNTPADKRLNSGLLSRTIRPQEKHWSAGSDQRSTFDVVGFTLAMTYEQALAFHEAEHADLESKLRTVQDQGTTSILYHLTEKGARRMGSDVFGEQVTLGFESQTREQMQVEQDPEVLAQIEQRKAILEQRAQMQQSARAARRRDGRRATSTADTESEDAIPEMPPMPKLRPEGADAELLFISRQVRFLNHQMPSRDNIIQALSAKYGPPSIRVEPRADRVLLGWVFDAAARRISDARGGPCDHLTKQPSAQSEKNKFYSPALRAAQAGEVFDLVTMSPECGLTAKAQLDLDKNGAVRRVSTTVYDTQRLLADEWYRIVQFDRALVAAEKAKTKTIESRDIPDF